MRLAGLLALVLFLPALVKPQTDPSPSTLDPPELQVVKHNWSKERIGWEQNPFTGAVESFEEMRVRSRNERRIDDAKKRGNTGEVNKLEREAQVDATIAASRRQKGPPRYAFLYKAMVRNTGQRAIKLVDWDYIFVDSMTQNEVGRHQFTSEEKIGPGKSKELTVIASQPPSKTISVHALDKNERKGLEGQVVVVRIEYNDGSVWERPK